jgi:hypothetical protein
MFHYNNKNLNINNNIRKQFTNPSHQKVQILDNNITDPSVNPNHNNNTDMETSLDELN